MNEAEAERALRSLIQREGRLQAPDDLEVRVLNRLTDVYQPIAPTAAILPGRIWLGLFVLIGFFVLLAQGGQQSAGYSMLPSDLFSWVHSATLRSKWLFMGVLCLTSLLLTDALIGRVLFRDRPSTT